MTRRRIAVALGLLIILAGLVVAAVGVHMLGGLAWGLIAYGAATAATGVGVVALWA